MNSVISYITANFNNEDIDYEVEFIFNQELLGINHSIPKDAIPYYPANIHNLEQLLIHLWNHNEEVSACFMD